MLDMLEMLESSGSGSSGNTTMPELWTYETIPATVVAFLAASLCSGVGIGGGAFYIATFILIVKNATVHFAVPLSKVFLITMVEGDRD